MQYLRSSGVMYIIMPVTPADNPPAAEMRSTRYTENREYWPSNNKLYQETKQIAWSEKSQKEDLPSSVMYVIYLK